MHRCQRPRLVIALEQRKVGNPQKLSCVLPDQAQAACDILAHAIQCWTCYMIRAGNEEREVTLPQPEPCARVRSEELRRRPLELLVRHLEPKKSHGAGALRARLELVHLLPR